MPARSESPTLRRCPPGRSPHRAPRASEQRRLRLTTPAPRGGGPWPPSPPGSTECGRASGRGARAERQHRRRRQQQLPHARPLRAERAAGLPLTGTGSRAEGGRRPPAATGDGTAHRGQPPPRPEERRRAGRGVRPRSSGGGGRESEGGAAAPLAAARGEGGSPDCFALRAEGPSPQGGVAVAGRAGTPSRQDPSVREGLPWRRRGQPLTGAGRRQCACKGARPCCRKQPKCLKSVA